jgi:hypothetical protein
LAKIPEEYRPPPDAGKIGTIKEDDDENLNKETDEVYIDLDKNKQEELKDNFEKIPINEKDPRIGNDINNVINIGDKGKKRQRDDEDKIEKEKPNKFLKGVKKVADIVLAPVKVVGWIAGKFIGWFVKLIIDNAELFLSIGGEVLKFFTAYNPLIMILIDLSKKSIAQYSRVLYYTQEQTPWLEGEGFWEYISKLFNNLIDNTFYFIVLKLVYIDNDLGLIENNKKDKYINTTSIQDFAYNSATFIENQIIPDVIEQKVYDKYKPENNTILSDIQWKFIMEGNAIANIAANIISFTSSAVQIINLLINLIPKFLELFGRGFIKFLNRFPKLINNVRNIGYNTIDVIKSTKEIAIDIAKGSKQLARVTKVTKGKNIVQAYGKSLKMPGSIINVEKNLKVPKINLNTENSLIKVQKDLINKGIQKQPFEKIESLNRLNQWNKAYENLHPTKSLSSESFGKLPETFKPNIKFKPKIKPPKPKIKPKGWNSSTNIKSKSTGEIKKTIPRTTKPKINQGQKSINKMIDQINKETSNFYSEID